LDLAPWGPVLKAILSKSSTLTKTGSVTYRFAVWGKYAF